MIGYVIESHAARPAMSPENEAVLDVRVQLEEGRKAKRVDRTLQAAGVVLNGKRKAVVVFDQEGQRPILARKWNVAPAGEPVGRIPRHAAHVIGDHGRAVGAQIDH